MAGGLRNLEEVVRTALERESSAAQVRLWGTLKPKDIWVDLRGRTRDWDLDSTSFWEEKTRIHLVYPHPTFFDNNDDPDTTPSTDYPLPRLPQPLLRPLGTFEEFEYMANNVRFVSFPSDPVVRRLFWTEIVSEAEQQGRVYDMLELEDDEELEAAMLEVVKGKDWAWIEEDGREVEFEEGLRLIEDVEES